MRIRVNDNAPETLKVNGLPLKAGQEYDLPDGEAVFAIRTGHASLAESALATPQPAAPAVKRRARKSPAKHGKR